MFEDVHERLIQAQERLRRREKVDAMVRSARELMQTQRERCTEHEQILARELKDVEQLEGYGLAGLFYSILGTKEERLKQERQEWLAAKLKHEECTAALAEAQAEFQTLLQEQFDLRNAAKEFEQVLQEKEQLLLTNDGARESGLWQLSERIADLKADLKELQEAIHAGEQAQAAVQSAQKSLSSAQNWGVVDLLGGGMMVGLAKHANIDSARKHTQDAQRLLRKFAQELAEADTRLHLSLEEIRGFSKFADFFMDGLIFDWIAQTKITKSAESCATLERQVGNVLRQCRQRRTKITQELEACAQERHDILTQDDSSAGTDSE